MYSHVCLIYFECLAQLKGKKVKKTRCSHIFFPPHDCMIWPHLEPLFDMQETKAPKVNDQSETGSVTCEESIICRIPTGILVLDAPLWPRTDKKQQIKTPPYL